MVYELKWKDEIEIKFDGKVENAGIAVEIACCEYLICFTSYLATHLTIQFVSIRFFQ